MSSNIMTIHEFWKHRQACEMANGLLVVDGDWLAYNALSAAEKETRWDDNVWSLECDHNLGWDIVTNYLTDFRERKKAWRKGDIVLAWSDRPNFRYDLLDSYKAGRKETRKPLGYKDFEQRMKESPELGISIFEPNLEGDDVMGILGSGAKHFKYKKAVLISVDKDFKTIPGCDFYHLTDGNIHPQTDESADRFWWWQSLKGDVVDGYTGIPMMGDKAASDFLDEPWYVEQVTRVLKTGKNAGTERTTWETIKDASGKSMWECAVTLAAKQGMSEEELLANFRCARILRYGDYDHESQTIKLWTPSA